MFQLNMTITADFERNLYQLMKMRGITSEFEAIILAVRETLERTTTPSTKSFDFKQWIGCAKNAPENPNPHFKTEDALWE